MDQRLNELANAPVGRLMLRYSIPAVVGIMVMQLYNVVDRIFIGQVVGANAIAGLAITFPVANISTALGVLVGAGASARVSLLLGNGNHAGARRVCGNALTLTLLFGIAYLTMFAVFMDPVLELFGATEETIPYARDMMTWILPGLLLTNVAFSFNNVMRASGFPTKAMVTMMVGAGVNILLDPLFIYVFNWGIRGAALATDIAMASSAVYVMAHFVKPHGPVHFERGTYRLERRLVWSIVVIGLAPFLVNLASFVVNIFINHVLYRYGGAGAIAGSSVFITVTALAVAFIIGLTQGMQPIVGYNYGAGAMHRLRRAYWIAVGGATLVSAVGCALCRWCGPTVCRAFLRDPELIDQTAGFLRIATALFWMVGFQIVTTVFFQAIGAAGKAIILSLCRQILFLLPLLMWLPGIYGLDGIWASFPTSDALATVVAAILITWQSRRLKHLRRPINPMQN